MHNDPWKHRTTGMSCATCMWYVRKVSTEDKSDQEETPKPRRVIGRCRRRSLSMNGYPAVFNEDWCGDYKIDENTIY